MSRCTLASFRNGLIVNDTLSQTTITSRLDIFKYGASGNLTLLIATQSEHGVDLVLNAV